MKTKNILLVAVMTAFMAGTQVMAQNNTTRQNRADVNELMDKRCDRMCKQLKLDDATMAKFAPLYKEYLKDMRACRPSDVQRKNNVNMTDAERKACMERRMECREKMAETQKEYYDKFEKFLTAEQLRTVFNAKRHAHANCDKTGRRNGKCNHKGNKRHNQCDSRGHQHHCND